MEKIKDWFKKNWILLSIIAFAIVIRIYYFILTQGQVGWWDECEYILISQKFAFGLDYDFGPVRPVLFSFITSLFLRILNTEFLPRLLILILSIATVPGMYLLGKELFNKKVGLISAFLMSIFYLNLFFTYRLLVDLPSLTFFIYSAYFFFKYFKTKKNSSLYWATGMVAIGTLFKLSTAFILPAIFIYILITQGFSFIKKKEIWISVLIFILIMAPYIIWGYLEFGGFILTQASGHVSPESYFAGFNTFKNYLTLFPSYFSWYLLIPFICGMVMMYKVFLYFDKLLKGDNYLKRDLYLLLILLVPLTLVSFLINHNENRYIITIFPAIFLISSSFIMTFYNFAKKYNKLFTVLFFVCLLGFITNFQINNADNLIKYKIDSYGEIKEVGLWLKENTKPEDVIATRSLPHIRYYAERSVIGLPKTEEEFDPKNADYLMLSIFEIHPEWAYDYPLGKNLTIAKYYMDENQQPLIIIYKLNNGNEK